MRLVSLALILAVTIATTALGPDERWEAVPLGPVTADVAVGLDGRVGLVASVVF